jgi:hypothetical protein
MRQIVEGRFAGIADENDVASAPPVAAGGAPAGYEFFAPEGDGTIAAVAGNDANAAFIDELH